MPLTLRAWLRYLGPLTVLSALVFLPLVYVALRLPVPADLPKARVEIRFAWALAGVAFAFQLWLAAAAAPAVRGLEHRQPCTQWRAFTAGVRGLVRGIVPCAIAVAAIVLGGVAVVVPGVMLLVLLAFTTSSEQLAVPPPAPLVDSVRVARASLRYAAAIVLGIVAVNLAVTFAVQTAIVPAIAKKAPAVKLAPIRTYVRLVPVALALIAPGAACALAAAYCKLTRRTR